MKCRSAFTLVELLAVVTIIGVLLALLIPAFDQAMESARIAKCLANEKSIYAAYKTYVISNRGRGFASRNWHRWHAHVSLFIPPDAKPTDWSEQWYTRTKNAQGFP